jgi:hypothetical protein
MSELANGSPCGHEFVDYGGKGHCCILIMGHRGRCLCDCGEKSGKTKTPLKLAHWKRGKKVAA